jgi:uncharacterized protein YceK
MARTGAVIVLLGLTFATSGCGTISNMNGQPFLGSLPPPRQPPKPFGGVINDGVFIASCGYAVFVRPDVLEVAPLASLALIDLPFSLVADIVTLPWVAGEMLNVSRPQATGANTVGQQPAPNPLPERVPSAADAAPIRKMP